jgi:hypothetical protein
MRKDRRILELRKHDDNSLYWIHVIDREFYVQINQ